MNADQIAQRYLELRMVQEEEVHTDCGFAAATKKEQGRLARIRRGEVTEEDFKELEFLFQREPVDLRQHIKVRKPSLWQRITRPWNA